jgi:predicted RNA-binding protein
MCKDKNYYTIIIHTMNNDNELFLINRQLYSKLAEFNNKYHLYSKCLKEGNDCKSNGADLEVVYENVKTDMDSLLRVLNNNKTISGNIKDIDIDKKIEDNNKLRIKLQNDLDSLLLSKDLNLKPNTNYAIESGLLWITLTTVCIYYIIVKL